MKARVFDPYQGRVDLRSEGITCADANGARIRVSGRLAEGRMFHMIVHGSYRCSVEKIEDIHHDGNLTVVDSELFFCAKVKDVLRR